MGKIGKINLWFLLGGLLLGYALATLSTKVFNFGSNTENTAQNKPLYWIDPMEPNIHYDGPGKSRMGMELVPIYSGDSSSNSPTVKINPNIVQNLGIKTAVAEKKTLTKTIKTLGYVQETSASNPVAVDKNDPKIANSLIVAEIPETESVWLKQDQPVTARLIAYPTETFQGTINYISSGVDPSTRTVRIKINSPNAPSIIKQNATVELLILAKQTEPVISVPKDTIIPYGFQNRVFVALDDGAFQARLVNVGLEGDDDIEIKAGIKEQEKVIVSGQFLLDSEASLKGLLPRLEEKNEHSLHMDHAKHMNHTMHSEHEKHNSSSHSNQEPAPTVADHASHNEHAAHASHGVQNQVPKSEKELTNPIENQAEISAIGIVQDIMSNPLMVTLQHDAIPEFKLAKASTMFYVNEKLDIANLKPGTKIRFTLSKTYNEQLMIDKIKIEE